MTDDTSAALGRIKAALDYKHRHVQLTEAQAREVLAHIAALEARAERAEQARAEYDRWISESVVVPQAEYQAMVAREAELREALEKIADERHFRSGHDQSDVGIEPALNATEAQRVARQALAAALAAPAPSNCLDGARPLPFDREELGRMVREAWVRWAQTQPNPKPSWLVPYDELSDADKEADRQIGEAISRWTLIGDAAGRSLAAPPAAEPVAWRVRVRSDDPEEWSILPAGAGADYLHRLDYEVQPLFVARIDAALARKMGGGDAE